MVTIKIQSQGDIINAYLKTFGFEPEAALQCASDLEKNFDESIKNGEEIITELDKRLLSNARKIWPLSEYESEQIVALFKLLYLMNDGAAKWGDIIFYDKDIPEDLYKIMASHNMTQAPNYALSQMQPQKIEPAIPQHWLRRLLRFFHKKAS